jgi:hypothetical protein
MVKLASYSRTIGKCIHTKTETDSWVQYIVVSYSEVTYPTSGCEAKMASVRDIPLMMVLRLANINFDTK